MKRLEIAEKKRRDCRNGEKSDKKGPKSRNDRRKISPSLGTIAKNIVTGVGAPS